MVSCPAWRRGKAHRDQLGGRIDRYHADPPLRHRDVDDRRGGCGGRFGSRPAPVLMAALVIAEAVVLSGMVLWAMWVPHQYVRFFLWMSATAIAFCGFVIIDRMLVVMWLKLCPSPG